MSSRLVAMVGRFGHSEFTVSMPLLLLLLLLLSSGVSAGFVTVIAIRAIRAPVKS
uniref:Transmembrane protein n=1 Tax=Macrostomum lignano TaxID=282301 RepID=A0A1I8J8N0_9PLAT